MRVLITGATGLVGSKITQLCHKKGISVNYLTTDKNKIQNKSNYNGFYWNPRKNQLDETSLEDVDAIFNLAGASVAKRWTPSQKEKILNSRIDSTNLLFNTLQKSKYTIPHIISASAIGVYPSSLEKLNFENQDAVADNFLGEVVERWETAVDEFKDLGMIVSKVRIGLVLSKKGGALEKMKEPISYNMGSAFGSGKQWQSWIHIEDLARIFLFIKKNKLEGVYNGVAPNPVTNNELMQELANQMDKSMWLPNVPAFVLKTTLGEMSSILLGSQLVSSNKIEEAGFQFQYSKLQKAFEDLI